MSTWSHRIVSGDALKFKVSDEEILISFTTEETIT